MLYSQQTDKQQLESSSAKLKAFENIAWPQRSEIYHYTFQISLGGLTV